MPKLVQFGAGNIGRSFIGQLFARAGYEVVFIDVDMRTVNALNERHEYRIEVKDDPPDELIVKNVRAVNGNDRVAVVEELVGARICGTAVGIKALPYIYPSLAAGIAERRRRGDRPLDVILCENLHHAADQVRAGLAEQLPPDFPLQDCVGLIETSIGKMVPIVPEAVRQQDPLVVQAEAYNTLFLDALAFKNPIPRIPGLAARTNMHAYVDRKLYIHNLGHAAVAYETARRHPGVNTIGEAVLIPDVRELAQAAMRESALALEKAYPDEFNNHNLEEHIQDLLRRFKNPALGDTVFRVGRDLRRKLAREDRIIGAMLLDLGNGVQPLITARIAAAAMQFRATDENGHMDPGDSTFVTEDLLQGPDHVFSQICGLRTADSTDNRIRDLIEAALYEQGAFISSPASDFPRRVE